MPGRILILNGAPRSGKTTLARAVQAHIPGRWINWGVDAFNATLPPGIGLRPGGERPELEADVARLYAVYFCTLAGLARQNFDVVADLGMHANYASPFDPLNVMNAALGDLPRLLVGVDCALDIIMARRNADPHNGLYVAGPGVPAPVQRWQDHIHAGKSYDIRLDMGLLTPEAGVQALLPLLADTIDCGGAV